MSPVRWNLRPSREAGEGNVKGLLLPVRLGTAISGASVGNGLR